MTREDGYIAADALAALTIVGLAVAGLMSGLQVIGVAQMGANRTLSQAVSVRSATQELALLFNGRGPFRSDEASGFAGDRASFSFPCGAERCSARAEAGRMVLRHGGIERVVALPRAGRVGFQYVGTLGPTAVWPPAALPPPAPSWQGLQSVILKDETATMPIAIARVWSQQSASCEFDVVIQDCRKAQP